MGDRDRAADRFAEALLELEAELDWVLLGRLYCSDGGEHRFGPADRESVRETGLHFASDVAGSLAGLGGEAPRALYVGAAVAELAPILCERTMLGREVAVLNLPGPECDELNRALEAVSDRLELPLPRISTEDVVRLPRASFDHGWMVSVLTDPEAFPALHDHLYGRTGGELSAGGGDLEWERIRARALIVAFLDALRPPCVLTTTDDELELIAPACSERGLRLEVPETARVSAIVGDPVRVCRLMPGRP